MASKDLRQLYFEGCGCHSPWELLSKMIEHIELLERRTMQQQKTISVIIQILKDSGIEGFEQGTTYDELDEYGFIYNKE